MSTSCVFYKYGLNTGVCQAVEISSEFRNPFMVAHVFVVEKTDNQNSMQNGDKGYGEM